MTRQPDDESGLRTGGRSGNDFLARGREGYESWAAEGPSGAVGHGGPGDVPSLENTATWHALGSGSSRRESSAEGRSGILPLLVGVGVGAALMYFLDRERGAERRRQASERLMGAVKSGQRAAQGAVASVRERVGGGNGATAPHEKTATVVADVDDPRDIAIGDEGARMTLP